MQARTAIRLSTLGILATLLACDGSQVLDPPAIPIEAHAMMNGMPLAAPSGTTATAISISQIDISWQDRSNNESGFEVRRWDGASFVTVARTAADVVAFSDRGLPSSTSYCYDVRALRVVGPNTIYSTFSISACATTLAPPPPPPPPPPTPASNVTATPAGSTTVRVTWTADSTATGFLIQRSSDGGATWRVVSTAPVYYTSIEDRFAPSEQMDCYRVVATNAGGEAPPSNTACAVPPAAPSLLTATPVDAQTVELNWADNSNVEDGYEAWFYELVRDESGNQYYTGLRLAALPPNATTVRIAPVACDVNAIWVYYAVVATSGGGSSDQSYATICGGPPTGGGAVDASVQLTRRGAPLALGHPVRSARPVRNR